MPPKLPMSPMLFIPMPIMLIMFISAMLPIPPKLLNIMAGFIPGPMPIPIPAFMPGIPKCCQLKYRTDDDMKSLPIMFGMKPPCIMSIPGMPCIPIILKFP
jgi:hypothetical protein